MPPRYGLKLWNINHAWFPEAIKLCQQGTFDFIELYIMPGRNDLVALKPLQGLDVRLHAPHENHGFNVFSLDTAAVEMFRRDVVSTADFFQSKTIVVHAGAGTDATLYLKNLESIRDPRIIIENMPYHGIHGEVCFGYSLEQLEALQAAGLRLCIDIGHAMKSAVTQKLDPKEFFFAIGKKFGPTYFHISDGDTGVLVDEHLSLGQGNYDFGWIKPWLAALGQNQTTELVFEIPKNGTDLANDVANLEYFKKL